ncbi:MAG: 50S ribosomal protein L40e [Candidatus Aenigmatarchaeota archaeon]
MSEEVAKDRLFKNVYICLKCKARNRAKPRKVKEGKVKCRKCGSKDLRPKSKEDRS